MKYKIGVTDVSSDNQRLVRDAVNEMKREGHAISYDSTEDSMMKFVSARVLHYRTCKACANNALQDTQQGVK